MFVNENISLRETIYAPLILQDIGSETLKTFKENIVIDLSHVIRSTNVNECYMLTSRKVPTAQCFHTEQSMSTKISKALVQ